jgi:hypothetical protein
MRALTLALLTLATLLIVSGSASADLCGLPVPGHYAFINCG